MKHVVSVSLGSSKRETRVETEILGQAVLLERRAADGDLHKAGQIIRELDGRVDAIGLGGIDITIYLGPKRYTIRDGARLAAQAKTTPVVCGAGLKDTLERHTVKELAARIDWPKQRVLIVSALDRFGMAEALYQAGAKVVYGDAVFVLGLPLALTSLGAVHFLGRLLIPPVVRMPFTWIYPTGSKQESSAGNWRGRYYRQADVIAGDFHYIKRYAPERLDGKTIVTNTTTSDDVETMRAKGVSRLITTTPRYHGRSLSTNLLEAALIAVAGKHPLTPQDYQELIARAELKPDVLELNPRGS